MEFQVGPYAVIEEGAVVGNGSIVEAHAIIKKWARIGENVRVGHFSVLGGDLSIPISTAKRNHSCQIG